MKLLSNHRLRNVIIAIIVIGVAIAGYWLPGFGFDGYTSPERSTPIKTLWDWLDLLIVPAILLFGGAYLARRERERDIALAKEKEQQEKKRTVVQKFRENREAKLREEIARLQLEDTTRESVLQNYLDRIAELMLSGALRAQPSQEKRDAVALAVIRTSLALRRLGEDSGRRDIILDFLHDSGLVERGAPTIEFRNANWSKLKLSGAPLFYLRMPGANLSEADLSKSNLTECDFSGADLVKANLSVTNLTGANFTNANLRGADLSGANLTLADFSGAVLDGAKLIDVTLNGTKITDEQVKSGLNPNTD